MLDMRYLSMPCTLSEEVEQRLTVVEAESTDVYACDHYFAGTVAGSFGGTGHEVVDTPRA